MGADGVCRVLFALTFCAAQGGLLPTHLLCRGCGQQITDATLGLNILSPLAETASLYSTAFPDTGDLLVQELKNPNNATFQVVTFSSATNVDVVTSPTDEATFWPPHAWSIVVCSRCHWHLGWKFTSDEKKPKSFFGLLWPDALVEDTTGDEEGLALRPVKTVL